jgi:hypothetical protein
MSKSAILAVLLIIVGQAGAWFQQFSQSRFEWMKNNLWVNIFIIGSIVSCSFVFAAKYGMESFGSAWSYRLVQFCIGVFVFTYLTQVFLGENISVKNGICIGLSVLIILIQAFWK